MLPQYCYFSLFVKSFFLFFIKCYFFVKLQESHYTVCISSELVIRSNSFHVLFFVAVTYLLLSEVISKKNAIISEVSFTTNNSQQRPRVKSQQVLVRSWLSAVTLLSFVVGSFLV